PHAIHPLSLHDALPILHQASVTRRLESARDVLHRLCGPRLTALFGPQHGIAGELQDNMIESGHTSDGRLGIPVFSLYSETRSPTDRKSTRLNSSHDQIS